MTMFLDILKINYKFAKKIIFKYKIKIKHILFFSIRLILSMKQYLGRIECLKCFRTLWILLKRSGTLKDV